LLVFLLLRKLNGGEYVMAWWKKGLIIFGIAVILFGAGFGTAVLLSRTNNISLRERIEYLTKQYEQATAAQRDAEATVERLKRSLSEATITVERLESTVRELRARGAELEKAINAITAGIDSSTGTTEESERLIQESLRVLLAISERSRTDNK
jgi:peptidoglycan hydrolase CwlO-like protein